MAIVTSLVSVAGISAGDVPRRGSVVVEEGDWMRRACSTVDNLPQIGVTSITSCFGWITSASTAPEATVARTQIHE